MNNIESEVDSLYIGMIHSNGQKAVSHSKDSKWFKAVTVRDVPVKFKLDTGTDASVLPMSIFRLLPGPIQLRPTKTVLIAFGGARLPSGGAAFLQCKTATHTAAVEFHVTHEADKTILDGDTCTELGLVKRGEAIMTKNPQPSKPPSTKQELIEKYAEVFTGLGEFARVHHIHVDTTVPPVIHGCRNIHLSIMHPLKQTLQDLEKREVIKAVVEPTQWVNSLVATKKRNGSLRVCLDPCNLNEAVQRQHFSIPTPEDVRSKLAGKTIFTILG